MAFSNGQVTGETPGGWMLSFDASLPGLATAAGDRPRDARSRAVGAVRSFSGSQGRPAPAASKGQRGTEAGAAQAEAGAGARSGCYYSGARVPSSGHWAVAGACVSVCCELSGAQPPPVSD